MAIDGKNIMSAELDKIYNSLMNNQVPKFWSNIAYPSLKPLSSWFEDLKERVKFMNYWLKSGNPVHFWLPGLFFPQGFLTGVLQTHARTFNMPIDKFSFTFKVTDYTRENLNYELPEEGVYISGLFLEGAHWDLKRKAIIDSVPNKMYVAMPNIHFIPKEISDHHGNIYNCPLYKTLARAGSLSTTG